jgi:hypothetical protein
LFALPAQRTLSGSEARIGYRSKCLPGRAPPAGRPGGLLFDKQVLAHSIKASWSIPLA